MTPEQNAYVKTLKTREEIFDYVESHLKNQGQRSIHLSGDLARFDGSPAALRLLVDAACAYRGEGGTMCAVGCLLADDEYDPGMEGCAVDELADPDELCAGLDDDCDGCINCLASSTTISPGFPDRLIPHRRMLADLQGLHDRVSSWSSSGKGLSSQGISRLRELRQEWLKDSN